MGACASSPAGGDPAADARSKEIDRLLREDEKRMGRNVRVLLLGAGNGGKTTILKQMKILHSKPFTADEREDYRKITFSNLCHGVRNIIDILDELGVAVEPKNRRYIGLIDNEIPINTGEAFPMRYLDALKALWVDPAVIEVRARGHEWALQDNLPFFFDKIDEIFAPGWQPGTDDILRVRSKTTGINETKFELQDLLVTMVDVGGQRSERRKWISAFEAVTSVLFIVALSDYNASIIEDKESNGMNEAIVLFESIINSQWFVKSSMILFLNKCDLLAEKIRDPNQQIRDVFPDFKGKAGSYNDAIDYFKNRFRSLNRNPAKEVYVHVTQATDTMQTKVVMSAVMDTIVRIQLKDMAII